MGTLTGYGTFESVIHREGEPSHGVWYQSTAVGGILKTLIQSLPSPQIRLCVLNKPSIG